MRETSALYKSLRTAIGSYYEIELVRGETVYGMDRLKSIQISAGLYDGAGPQIGSTKSAECKVTVMELSENWPRMADFEVRVRLSSSDGTQKSEWLSMGTYYTDERKETKYGDLKVVAYDGMLLNEQSWTDKIDEKDLPAVWPITGRAALNLLIGANLITVDNLEDIDAAVPFVGLDTTSTVRDILSLVACGNGYNCQLTADGHVRFVGMANGSSSVPAVAGVAVAGISIVGSTDEGQDYGADVGKSYLGLNIAKLDFSPKLQGITGVELTLPDRQTVSAGNRTGYVVKANCDFSNSDIAAVCLNNLSGLQYAPFTGTTALLDPAAEVGDLVQVGSDAYQMVNIEWKLGRHITANLSAPFEEEVDHEYKMESEAAKTLRKAIANTDEKLKAYPTTVQLNSAIEQSASRITTSVSQTYVTITNYERAIQDLQDQIDGSINTFSGPDVPTLSNYPAVDWESATERGAHVGSLYLVTSDGGSPMAGQYYRFEQSGSSFAWVLVEDTALAAALAAAQEALTAAQQAIDDAEAAAQAAANAQGTADQARLDAVAEASKAQAAAQEAAALDAVKRVNEALAEAKAYAEQQVHDFVTGEYADDLAEITGQLDRKIETFYQSADPSDGWTEEEKQEHEGDLWYSMGDQLYYRWSGTAWEEMTANPPDDVFDTLDGKARVFVSTPTPPYSVGDIWTQGPNGDIFRCVAARDEGEDYVVTEDWTLASKYTDDSNLQSFINGRFAEMMESIKSQLDQKAETYYQAEDPSLDVSGHSKWNTIAGIAIVGVSIAGSSNEGHQGDMWYRTTDDTTWYWDGTQWVEQTISKEVFDTIDGKAFVFVTKPETDSSGLLRVAYHERDLWVNATYRDGRVNYSNEILRCISGKGIGERFDIADWQLASRYTDDSALSTFLDGYSGTLTNVRGQIDQKIQTWYQNTDPSTVWTTPELKSSHEGDLWYNTGDNNGFAKNGTYRWDGSAWVEQDAPKAVFDQIDGKAKIFVSQPEPPYQEGDLWVQGDSGDILRCKEGVDRQTGSFVAADWEKASKYTDDTAADAAMAAAVELENNYREFRTDIEQTVTDVTITVTETSEDLGELKTHYRFDENGETIGKSNSSKSMTLSNDGIDMMVNNESVTHWSQDEMYAPRKVHIPLGGSLQLGDFLWQPRSSGNMSLLWVGE